MLCLSFYKEEIRKPLWRASFTIKLFPTELPHKENLVIRVQHPKPFWFSAIDLKPLLVLRQKLINIGHQLKGQLRFLVGEQRNIEKKIDHLRSNHNNNRLNLQVVNVI